jgi:endoglucanase
MYDNIIYEIWNEPGWINHVRFPGLDPEDWNDRNTPDHLTSGGLLTPEPDDFGMDPVWVKYLRMLWQWNFDPWSRLDKSVNSIPVFVTEWGTSLYDGGQIETSTEAYTASSQDWITYMSEHNLSWCNWSICDKNEGAAALKSGASTSGNGVNLI